MKKKWIIGIAIIAFLVVCVLVSEFTDNGDSGNVDKNCSITSIKIKSPDSVIVKEIKAYGNDHSVSVHYESENDDDYKNIELISTNPDVATIKTTTEYKNNINGTITVVGKGESYIYAQTLDESVKSNKILVLCGEKSEDKCYIQNLSLSSEDEIFVFSNRPSPSIKVSYDSPFKEDYKNVEFVCSHPEIATVSAKSGNKGCCYGKITVNSDGQTEVYAKTKDGNIVSNTIMLTVGNKYNKELTVRSDISDYVFKKLKYNEIVEHKLDKEKSSSFFEHKNKKDEKEYVYKDEKKRSTVTCDSVKINDDNTAVVKGYASTFNEHAASVKCQFNIEVKYNDDFTKYEILSEKYDIPELIREVIDTKNESE